MPNDANVLTISDLGEQELLARLHRFCPAEIVGDDAAVLEVFKAENLVVTTDMLIDGVHFSVGFATPAVLTTSPADAGWRAAAANLSDLAAMGASPLGITIGLGLPGQFPAIWVEQLYQGIVACLDQYQTPILGGDVCRSPVLTLSITALGQAPAHRVIRRSGAQPGDAILATGLHGASRAGLELLLHPDLGQNLNPVDRSTMIRAHQRPDPRLDILPLLWNVFETSSLPIRVAGMDSSDGLADAIVQLCQASRVGARIERNQILFPPGLNQLVSSETAWDWVLYGGEDFELILCLPKEIAQILMQHLGREAKILGFTTQEPEICLIDSSGSFKPEVLTRDRGFQHF